MKYDRRSNLVLAIALETGKYTLLSLFGGIVLMLLTALFGNPTIVEWIGTILWQWLWRAGVVFFCMLASGIIIESWR